jgi:hypothetical protein
MRKPLLSRRRWTSRQLLAKEFGSVRCARFCLSIFLLTALFIVVVKVQHKHFWGQHKEVLQTTDSKDALNFRSLDLRDKFPEVIAENYGRQSEGIAVVYASGFLEVGVLGPLMDGPEPDVLVL